MIDFPNSPTVGQIFSAPNGTFKWDGTKWAPVSGVGTPAPKLQQFTASGTYTPTAGMVYCLIECVGGGGGSGGIAGTAAGINGSGGGGGGAYSRKIATAAQIGASQTVTIGAGGTAGAAGNNNGGNGGTTSVGTLCTAPGGSFSSGRTGITGFSFGGAGGVAGTADFSLAGGAGGTAFYASGTGNTTIFAGNYGGPAAMGFSGMALTIPNTPGNGAPGVAGIIYGGGASGAFYNQVAANLAGAAGAPGIVIITEFFG
jgi:hypothetical protein